jgi:hypothetical protein
MRRLIVLVTVAARTGARRRMAVFAAVGVLFLTPIVAACGATAGSTPRSGPAHSVASTPSADGPSYASTSFVVPFDVSPPAWLDPKPVIEQSNFLTWDAPRVPAVRFLAPETVYRPGDKTDTGVPGDYLSYLLSQASAGAHFRDQTRGTVGGQPATFVTATTDRSLDGSLGCPARGTAAAACFGLQPGLGLRIAVLQVHDRTLLIWLRTDKTMNRADVASHVQSFKDMLASIRFSSRSVQPAAPATITPLDGTYQMSISWPKVKVKNASARCVGGAEGTSAQVLYELVLDQGSVKIWVRVGGPTATRELGFADSYRILNPHQISFGGLTADFRLDGQALTLSNMQGGECGDVAIWTTKPWIRQ